jgi:hypothetical protein
VTLLTVKRPSPSAKSRALGEAFPERRASSRGRFNAVGAIRFFLFFKKKTSSPSASLGEEIYFLKNPLPQVQHSEKKFIFLKKSSSPSACPRQSGKKGRRLLLKTSSPSATA